MDCHHSLSNGTNMQGKEPCFWWYSILWMARCLMVVEQYVCSLFRQTARNSIYFEMTNNTIPSLGLAWKVPDAFSLVNAIQIWLIMLLWIQMALVGARGQCDASYFLHYSWILNLTKLSLSTVLIFADKIVRYASRLDYHRCLRTYLLGTKSSKT